MKDVTKRSGVRRPALRQAALFVTLTLVWPDSIVSADDPLCFGGSSLIQPSINGQIVGDQGWAKSNQYVFGNGTTKPDAIVHMMHSAGTLYFGFQVNHDPAYNEGDVIVLLLGTVVADPTKDWRIHIYPVSNSGNATNSPPREVKAWQNSVTWPTRVATPDATNPSWLSARVSTQPPASGTVSYTVEASIDMASAGIASPAGQFKFHFNILRLYTTTTGGVLETKVAGQLNWPENATVPGVPNNPQDSELFANPSRNDWGFGEFYGTCPGIRVKTQWINTPTNFNTLNPPPVAGQITNNYYVQIENTGTEPSDPVLATINAARFGIAGQFGKVPASPNPLRSFDYDPHPITPNQTRDLGPAAWTIDRATYDANYALSRTICSLIQLDVDTLNASGTPQRSLIANRYQYWNTHFAAASVVRHNAVLDTRGFGPPVQDSAQRFDLLVVDREFAGRIIERDTLKRPQRDTLQVQPTAFLTELTQFGGLGLYEQGAAFLARTVCGFRHTGRFISVDGVSIELMERAPCFGYWIHHVGALRSWRQNLTAAGLEKSTGPFYTISVPADSSVQLVTTIEAVEGPRIRWWLIALMILIVLVVVVVIRRRPQPTP